MRKIDPQVRRWNQGARLSDHAYAGIVEIINDQGSGGRAIACRRKRRWRSGSGVSRAIVREALGPPRLGRHYRGAGGVPDPSWKSRPVAAPRRLHAGDPNCPRRSAAMRSASCWRRRLHASPPTRRSPIEMAHVEEGMEMLRTALLSSEPAHAEDMETAPPHCRGDRQPGLPDRLRRAPCRCRQGDARRRRHQAARARPR